MSKNTPRWADPKRQRKSWKNEKRLKITNIV